MPGGRVRESENEMPQASGYPHPELLETTEWLAAHLRDDGLVVLDGRPPGEYAAGHVPGAINVLTPAFKAQGSFETCSAEEFAEAVGALGIRPGDTVVCYDAGGPAAARLWWAFTRFGHANVRFLHGGIRKWLAEQRPLEHMPVTRPAVAYQLRELHNEIACTLPQAIEFLGDSDVVFWDTRSDDEFSGARAMNNPAERAGHIPRAIHLEWSELTDPATGMFRPAEEMREVLAAKGITPEKEIVTY